MLRSGDLDRYGMQGDKKADIIHLELLHKNNFTFLGSERKIME